MIQTLIPLRQAFSDKAYFGSQLAGDTWANWRAILLAIAGEPLEPGEAETFTELTKRQKWPQEPAREQARPRQAVYAARLASCHDYRDILAPGECGEVMIISQSREQAANLFNFVRGVFESAPALRPLVENVVADTLSLSCRVDITVRPASFRSTRGSTAIAVLCDEMAFWRSEDSANPDTRALRPSLMTARGPLIAISSPYARRGEVWKAYRKHFGNDRSKVIVIQAASQTMNPSLDGDFIAEQYADDPLAAAAEYGAEFRSDIEQFVSIEILQSCTPEGLYELPPDAIGYVAFVDPSGGSADSMTLAIAHRDNDGAAILDCIREARPPFSPESVVEEFAKILREYHVTKVLGDRYAGEWPREQFDKRGITYEPAEKSKSDLYRDLLPLLNSRKCQLLDNKRLLAQLQGLERRTARGGRDSIDHGPGAHDDVANAVAGALVLASYGTSWPELWRRFEEALA